MPLRQAPALAALSLLLAASAARAQEEKSKTPPLELAYSADDREHVAIRFSPDGRLLAAGGSGFIRLFSVPSSDTDVWKEEKLLSQRGIVNDLRFTVSGRELVARSRDDGWVVWDVAEGKRAKYSVDDPVNGTGITNFITEGWLVLPKRHTGVELWQVGDALPRRNRSVMRVDVISASGVQLGRITGRAATEAELFLGDDDGYLIRTTVGSVLYGLLGDPRSPNAVARSARSIDAFKPHDGAVTSVILTPDHAFCATAGVDNKVHLWVTNQIPSPDAKTGRRPVVPKPKWTVPGYAVEMSRDGKLLAIAEPDGVGVYNVASGSRVSFNPTRDRKGLAVRVAFSPDGRRLAAVLCTCVQCRPGSAGFVKGKQFDDHGGTLFVWR